MWIYGYSIMPYGVEVFKELPSNTPLDRHLLHGFLLRDVREHIALCDNRPIAP
jgi:hypothetical protein